MSIKFKVKKWLWHLRRILNLGEQYLFVTWKTVTGGRVGLVSKLSARTWSPETGWVDRGILGTRCVTDAFCALLVDYLQGSGSGIGTIGLFKYHDMGTGTTAEATTDTGLVTPCGMAREVGTQAEGSGAYIYQSVATFTNTISGTTAITEHGLFDDPGSSVEIMLDRTKFAAINLDLGNKIEFTYELQVVAGG